ncbi:MAG: hypothetical protein ACOC80_07460 [Petrotogales bacterium]
MCTKKRKKGENEEEDLKQMTEEKKLRDIRFNLYRDKFYQGEKRSRNELLNDIKKGG